MERSSLVGINSSNLNGVAAPRGISVHCSDAIRTASLSAFDPYSERGASGENDNDGSENERGSVRVVSGSGFRYVVPFPWRLHQMLEDIAKTGQDSIVSWLPDGFHFQVHNPQLFTQQIIPQFFKQKSYKSFQRQLHLYGFQRVLEGPKKGAYLHESFVKDDRKLSLEITRIKAPKRRRIVGKGDEKADPACQEQPSSVAKSIPCRAKENMGSSVLVLKNSNTSHNQTSSFIHNISKLAQDSHCVSDGLRDSPCSNPSGQDTDTPSVAETYEWLINAGVPFSAFDPIAIESKRSSNVPKDGIGSDIFDCADEIKSLFSAPSSPITQPQWSQNEGILRNDAISSLLSSASSTIRFDDGILDMAPLDLQWCI